MISKSPHVLLVGHLVPTGSQVVGKIGNTSLLQYGLSDAQHQLGGGHSGGQPQVLIDIALQ